MRKKLVYIDDVISYLEKTISPLNRQLDWDNSGKQLYFGNEKISKMALALDPSAEAINTAINKGCGLLITHHPLFFDSFRSFDFSEGYFKKIQDAIINRISIVSFHTNFDVANFNLSDYIASILGAEKERQLEITGTESYYKFIVYVPEGFEDKIIEAIDNSGGGTIGNYKKCTFLTHGTGTFEPQEGTKPFIGKIGKLEKVNEVKIETIVGQKFLKSLINNVLAIHPYEEVAYDVYKLENKISYGIGTCCSFKKSLEFSTFLDLLKNILKVKNIRTNGSVKRDLLINRFCIVAGSGASYWRKCKNLGYNILVSGDLKHHDAIDAYENGITIIDIGHFEIERLYMNYIAEILNKKFDIDIIVINESSPIKHLEV
jgi:dinuclear metal center YbgI/SA1388 family protein